MSFSSHTVNTERRGGEILLFSFPVTVRLGCVVTVTQQHKWDSARVSIEKSKSEWYIMSKGPVLETIV